MAGRRADALGRGAATSPARPRPGLTEAQVDGEISRMARGVTWTLRVPGRHYGGLPYEELLDVLAEQGRDFLADTSALRRAAVAEVQLELAGLGRSPTWGEFKEAYGRAVLKWLVKRFKGRVRDEPLRRLTLAYAERKRRDGYGGAPIGTRTGALAARVEDFGSVNVRR